MIFADMGLDLAEGAVLAHTVRAGTVTLKKGTVLGAADIVRLRSAGVTSVLAARLEPGDVGENEAARRLAAVLCGDGITTDAPIAGRVNLRAAADGLCQLSADAVHAVNAVHEGITLATLPPLARVGAGDLVATVKIIPFGVPEAALGAAVSATADTPLRLAAFSPMRAVLIVTGPKTAKAVSVTRARLTALGADLVDVRACGHNQIEIRAALADALSLSPDILLMLGQTATTDRRDVIPAAIAEAGGRISHFGMPVDPGNLLMLAELGGTPTIVLPGCARSPAENGFDWVLERFAANIPVTAGDIQAMGVGGLLKEIPTRPQPRESRPAPDALRIAALLLAAGGSRRMGPVNKLLEEVGGVPLVRRAAQTLVDAGHAPLVVTGNEAARVVAVLDGLNLAVAHADDWQEGMSRSLRAGLASLPDTVDAAILALGDMPNVAPDDIRALAAAFDPAAGRTICVPIHDGRRGNPVVFGREFFRTLMDVRGDIGGRAVIEANREAVVEVPCGPGVLFDIDTPDALAKARGA